MTKAIMFGISGLHLTEEETAFFKQNKVVGFILFKRNIESSNQLEDLIKELKNIYQDHKVIITIDQEGGRVARLKPPVIQNEYPSAEYFYEIYKNIGKDQAISSAFKNYATLMNDLATFGINSPLAPVADLRYSYTDKVIGDRSFGNQVETVVDLCLASIQAIKEQGGFPVIKHIPGHGRATCDSHFELPRITTSLDELNSSDFEVFRRLAKNENVKCAMTAHIIYDVLDPTLPVTLSKKAIDFIREDIGFEKILFSDDICMLALHGEIGAKYHQDKDNKEYEKNFIESLANVARESIVAGCDIVLHCSGKLKEMEAVYNALPFIGEESTKFYEIFNC